MKEFTKAQFTRQIYDVYDLSAYQCWGTESCAELLETRIEYARTHNWGLVELIDRKKSHPVYVEPGRWVVLFNDEIVAYNLPDEVFKKRFKTK